MVSALAAAGAGFGYAYRRQHDGLERLIYHRLLRRLRPDVRSVTLADLKPDAEFDVCIVGSGPAGTTLGLELIERGLRTIVLESGGAWDSERGGTGADLDRYRTVGPQVYPLGGSRLRAVGGTSALWTGRASRFHPSDFDPSNPYLPDGARWPLTYAEMEPYYIRAEETLRVRGGGNSPHRAPRSRPLAGGLDLKPELVDLLERMELIAEPPPTSSSRWGEGPWRAHVDGLPDLTQSERADLVTRATATRIEVDGGNTVSGLVVRDPDGTVRTVRAAHYVVACGGAESARLLLLSRSPSFPRGIGNHGDQVGRNFMEHPLIELVGTVPDAAGDRWGAAATSHQFYDALKREALGGMDLTIYLKPTEERNLVLRGALEMEPSSRNRVSLSTSSRDVFDDPGADLHLEWTHKDLATWERVRGILSDLLHRAGARGIEESAIKWSHHHMGTTRMGPDPSRDVLDPHLRVHGVENLYVLSSSSFVTSGGSHPTVFIVALAHRLADHLTRSGLA